MGNPKIGIKYCGGCNPSYERVEFIQRVRSLAGDRFVFLLHDQQGLDGLITINGCLRACANKDFDQRGIPYRSISAEGDVETLMDWLKGFDE